MIAGHIYEYTGTEVLISDDQKSLLRYSIEQFTVLKVGTALPGNETIIVAIQYADGEKDFIVNPIDADYTEV